MFFCIDGLHLQMHLRPELGKNFLRRLFFCERLGEGSERLRQKFERDEGKFLREMATRRWLMWVSGLRRFSFLAVHLQKLGYRITHVEEDESVGLPFLGNFLKCASIPVEAD